MTAAPIALLTDFGTADWYVAEMKGVLLTHAPGAPLVDITHAIAPGDVATGAFVLARAHAAFPPGSVFVAVVDPGVGTERLPIALHAGGRFYVGPDNGLLEAGLAVAGAVTRVIDDVALLARASRTFHGRDVFAPVAARLAAQGVEAWSGIGRPLTTPVRLARAATIGAGAPGATLVTHVAHVDRFGNVITHLDARDLTAWMGGASNADLMVRALGAGGARVTELRGLAESYGDPSQGATPIALIGSSGLLEIAIPGGHAGLRAGLAPGDRIELRVLS